MMRLALAFLGALIVTGALAQQPVGTEQHGLGVVTSTALTVPLAAVAAEVCVSGAAVNFRMDGTAPTASVGMPIASGQCQQFCRAELLAVRFIQQSATAALDVAYKSNYNGCN